MGMTDLPDMYAESPRAAGPRAEGIHIRQITNAHVTSNMYHFWHSLNRPNLQLAALPIYIAMDSRDYGISILTCS